MPKREKELGFLYSKLLLSFRLLFSFRILRQMLNLYTMLMRWIKKEDGDTESENASTCSVIRNFVFLCQKKG